VIDKNLLSLNLSERNTGGKGNFRTQLVNLKDAMQLIMVLPGEMAKTVRVQIGEVMTDYFKGSESLVEQIRANAVSNAPICQLARACEDPVAAAPPACDALSKKRQLEMDEFELQIAMDERKQRLSMLASEAQMKAADAQMKVMGVQKMLMETYALLCPNQVMDDRARLLFKDNLLNIATQGTTPARAQLAIEDGAGPSGSPTVNLNKPITISTLAAELGYRFDSGQLQRIGKKAAAAFRDKYGESPSKHEQLVGQASIMVNSYTERDRKLLEGVIVAFINE
jgi:AraC-like DNA-binding protein